DRHDHAQVGVDVLELPAGEPEAQGVHAGAPPLLREADPQQLPLAHALQEVAVEAVRAVEVVDLRLDFLPRPLAHRLDERLVLLTQLQLAHGSSLNASPGSSRRCCSRRRASSACSAFTSTRTTAKLRTSGSGSC